MSEAYRGNAGLMSTTYFASKRNQAGTLLWNRPETCLVVIVLYWDLGVFQSVTTRIPGMEKLMQIFNIPGLFF